MTAVVVVFVIDYDSAVDRTIGIDTQFVVVDYGICPVASVDTCVVWVFVSVRLFVAASVLVVATSDASCWFVCRTQHNP